MAADGGWWWPSITLTLFAVVIASTYYFSVHVRLLAQTERDVRSAAGSAVRQTGWSGGRSGTSNGPVQPSV